MTLEGLYNLKLLDYKLNGYRDDPEKLLALQLLKEKDQYEPLKVCEGKFYESYKEKIDAKIAKVEKDFDITDTDITNYLEEKGVSSDDFEHDRIWLIYAEGFGSMHWGIMYHPELTGEEIYVECFNEASKDKDSETALRYQKIIKACRKYIEQNENKTPKEKVYHK